MESRAVVTAKLASGARLNIDEDGLSLINLIGAEDVRVGALGTTQPYVIIRARRKTDSDFELYDLAVTLSLGSALAVVAAATAAMARLAESVEAAS